MVFKMAVCQSQLHLLHVHRFFLTAILTSFLESFLGFCFSQHFHFTLFLDTLSQSIAYLPADISSPTKQLSLIDIL